MSSDPTIGHVDEAGPVAGGGPEVVAGRYLSRGDGLRLELRVDVEGERPLNRVSGDFFVIAGATTAYFGSFAVDAPAVEATGERVVVQGTGTFTHPAAAALVRVTLPRGSGEAAVEFLRPDGQAGSSYLCRFASRYFRTVALEQDSVIGTVPFVSYHTGSLPQPAGSAGRELSVVTAYAEAGIELRPVDGTDVIAATAAGADLAWDDAELHNAMVQHFSTYATTPQWRLWLLVASRHVGGYRGIMFDYNDSCQRQGSAVFYDAVRGADPKSQRAQLRTYVHELGHAFNLLHSWQKNLARPPQPLGPRGGFGDLSWMNYVQNYQPGGEPAYWAAFPFHFTDGELAHLRHGYFKDVCMGAGAFSARAAEVAMFEEPVRDHSGLALEVRAKDLFAFGEPVVVELKLSVTGPAPRATHGHLHPDTEFTHLTITQPGGRTVLYRPMMRHCVDSTPQVTLDAANPAAYASAYIGHGHDGHYFQQPGEYRVRAQHIAADGSRIVSPVCVIRVRHPITTADQRVAELMLGEEQGKLLSLRGSDSPTLRAGNAALDEVIERYGAHPVAVYARMVKGLNAEREFKDLTPGKDLLIRPPDTGESIQQLTAVAAASAGDGGVDNITLNMVMRHLARSEARQGDLEQAHDTLDRMVDTFAAKQVNPVVLDRIREQAEQTRRSLAGEAAGEPVAEEAPEQ